MSQPRKDQAEALRQQDRATGQATQAEKDAAGAEARIKEALDLWHDATDRARNTPDCPDLPEAPQDASALPPLATAIAELQRAEAAAQDDLARMRQELTRLTGQRDVIRKSLAGHATALEGLTTARASAESAKALAERDATTARDQAVRLATALLPILTSLDEAEALDDEALAARLTARVAQVETLRASREQAIATLTKLGPEVATAKSRADSAVAQTAKAMAQAKTRQENLLRLQAERADLLNGEATASHRTRHNDARKAALAALDRARATLAAAQEESATATARRDGALAEKAAADLARANALADLNAALSASDLTSTDLDTLFAVSPEAVDALRKRLRQLDNAVTSAHATLLSRQQDHTAALKAGLPEEPPEALAEKLAELETLATTRSQRMGAIAAEFQRDAQTRTGLVGLETEIATARAELDVWAAVNLAAGSRNGDRFTRIAQSITLDVLVGHANHHLADLNPRYRLRRAADLALQVEDRDMGDEPRATRSLSGGERFLVSLALALALSRMGGKGGLAATLFIDEGFGSLDATSLDLAIDALETLQSQGRQVGVISHVEAMKERIPVRVSVRKQGGGKSVVEVSGLESRALQPLSF